MDGLNDFIALQDVSVLGFKQPTRQISLSYEECKYILESVARFHSISFAFKHEKKDEFEKMVSFLSETYYTDHHYENWYKKFLVSLFVIYFLKAFNDFFLLIGKWVSKENLILPNFIIA